MSNERKPNLRATPSNPVARAKDDRFSSPDEPALLGQRTKEGRLANDVEQKGAAAPRSDTAQRSPDVNSFDATRTQDGTHKASSI